MAEGKKHSEKRRKAGKMAHEKRMAMPLTRLQGLREERRWSKAKAADAAGMDPTTYSRIERMVVSPFPTQAEAIAEAFGTTVYDLTDATILHAQDEQAPIDPDGGLLDLPESVDPMVELEQRVKALEDDLAATMASLGALKARHNALEEKHNLLVRLAVLKPAEAPAKAGEELDGAVSAPTPVWVTVNVFGNDGGES